MRKVLIAALVALAAMSGAAAQNYPARSVTAIVPASAGGRIVMQRAQQLLGQTIVIENIGGASGTIGTGRVARADPDGYTIGIGGPNHYVVNSSVYTLPYDTLKDFEPISLLSNGPMIIMSRNSLPAKNLSELVAWLKAQGDNVTFGTGGLASPPHVAGLSLQTVTGNKFQFIPFRGSAPALQQVIGGQLDIIIDQASSALSIVKGGNVRAYAVTAPQRLASAPDLPTVDEAGLKGFYVSIWQGVWAPKGTPKDVIAKLKHRKDIPERQFVQKRLSEVGQELPTKEQMTPEGFGAFHKAEMDKWTPIIKAANIKPEGT